VVIERGDIYWVDLGAAASDDHTPAKRRPVLVVQADAINRSSITTVLAVVVTSNLAAAAAPGNVLLPAARTGLPKDSVANVSQLATVNRWELATPRAGVAPFDLMRQVGAGLALMLDLRAIG
jgi:mRNA interferase MazF